MSNEPFRRQINDALIAYGEMTLDYQKAFVSELVRELVRNTPVQTGGLRGGWGLSLGPVTVPHQRKLEPGGGVRYSEGPVTVARIERLLSVLDESTPDVNIYNSTPYSLKVEYVDGRAYVRQTLANLNEIAIRAAARVDNV